ncbi:MAG: response regulator [Anaerolineae bacterium]|nr:response regulator [Anaerolineae bacterium]
MKVRQETILELRRAMLDRALVSISIATCGWIVFSNLSFRSLPWEATALALMVELVCAISYWIRIKQVQPGVYALFIGLWLCNAAAAQHFGLPVFLYLFSLISFTASLLMPGVFTVGITLISCLFMVTRWPMENWNQVVLPPLFMTWATLLTSRIFFHSLYQALDMAWNYEDYAIQQMELAREHRAELMKTTQALQQARADLERANVQLRHARNAAEEARHLKALFAANVSHELRTPINLIVGFSEMMAMAPQAYGVSLPLPYWSDVRTLYRSAKHLQSLINDVLDISQIEAGQMAVIKEACNPGDVINEAANLIRDLIESKELTFNVIVPEQLPILWLDRTRIRQVLLNLLGNAVRFTDQGTITLTASLEDQHLLVSVSDTGIGIKHEDLQRVFEEFHQLESSLARRQGGTGLGLTLSKHFVELHGGRMWVASDGIPGRGSIFCFTLPRQDHFSSWESGGPRLTSQPADEPQYFIVFDDDPVILQLFERYSSKHRVIGVRDQDEVQRLVNTIRPSALVMDEGQISAELLDVVQSNDCHTPIISCTMPSGRRAVQMNGVADYLVKPVSHEALLGTLARLSIPIREVLIIDDDQDIVRMFSRMLQAMPQPPQLCKAYSANEGLALMQQQRPDVIILDLLMPEVDGFELIQCMKSDPDLADIPIILTSARGAADAIAPSSDGELIVRKPLGFQPIELVRCVEALVDSFNPPSVPVQSA